MGDESNVPNTALDITVAVVIVLIAVGFYSLFSEQVATFYESVKGWFYLGGFRGLYAVVAFLFVVADALLFGFLVYALYRFVTLDERMVSPEPAGKVRTVVPTEEIKAGWEHVRELAVSLQPSDWSMAVIRADALLDAALRYRGYEGVSVADRLKVADPTILKSLDSVWSAHRLRNAIAHDPLEEHTKESIVVALRSYKNALRDLGFME